MICRYCETKAHTYAKSCVGCCARLVESTRPNVEERDKMLNFTTNKTGSFTRKQVIEELKSMKSNT